MDSGLGVMLGGNTRMHATQSSLPSMDPSYQPIVRELDSRTGGCFGMWIREVCQSKRYNERTSEDEGESEVLLLEYGSGPEGSFGEQAFCFCFKNNPFPAQDRGDA